ncbi:MAG TPA: hypothetical protein VNM92_06645 [Thermoanaerobaculia bacterium]|nr:hypothetical protein [Thermoanaerobaculia bacterium]
MRVRSSSPPLTSEGAKQAYTLDVTSPESLWMQLREGSRFFKEEGALHSTLSGLTAKLADEGIDYAVIDGIALLTHGYRRYTEDLDILTTRAGLGRFRGRLVGRGYRPAFPGAQKSYRDTETNVRIDFIMAGEYPGDGKPKPVSFPDPAEARLNKDGIWFITLEKLVELKLASGLSAPHRLKDLADIVELIVSRALSRDLAGKLDESVRTEYLRLWDAAQARPAE